VEVFECLLVLNIGGFVLIFGFLQHLPVVLNVDLVRVGIFESEVPVVISFGSRGPDALRPLSVHVVLVLDFGLPHFVLPINFFLVFGDFGSFGRSEEPFEPYLALFLPCLQERKVLRMGKGLFELFVENYVPAAELAGILKEAWSGAGTSHLLRYLLGQEKASYALFVCK